MTLIEFPKISVGSKTSTAQRSISLGNLGLDPWEEGTLPDNFFVDAIDLNKVAINLAILTNHYQTFTGADLEVQARAAGHPTGTVFSYSALWCYENILAEKELVAGVVLNPGTLTLRKLLTNQEEIKGHFPTNRERDCFNYLRHCIFVPSPKYAKEVMGIEYKFSDLEEFVVVEKPVPHISKN